MKKLLICLAGLFLLAACKPENMEKSDPTAAPVDPPNSGEKEPNIDVYMGDIWEEAKQGKIMESPFSVIESSIIHVKEKYGEPDITDQAGYGYYAAYADKKMVFGFNEEQNVFDIRSYSDLLRDITYESLIKKFGSPAAVRSGNDEKIIVYTFDNGVELKWIIPGSTNRVDHISVFHQKKVLSKDPSRGNDQKHPDYLLDIKGVSDQLSPAAWENMKRWREEIVEFARTEKNVYINGPDKKKVALTFDDGPDDTVTPAVIEILNRYHVTGNFFFIGEKAEKHPEIIQNAFDNGNLVLSHSFHHVDLTSLSPDEINKEISGAGKAIQSIIGLEPALIRTPYGETDHTVASIAKDQGYSIILWSIDTLDWSQKEADNIRKNVLDNVRNGDIILMHSNEEQLETAKALPMIIEGLLKRNFEIVDLGTLLGLPPYQ